MKFKLRIQNVFKRTVSLFLASVMLFGLSANFPVHASTLGDEYSIANDYIKYTFNARTGGFCIETKDGHPLVF